MEKSILIYNLKSLNLCSIVKEKRNRDDKMTKKKRSDLIQKE